MFNAPTTNHEKQKVTPLITNTMPPKEPSPADKVVIQAVAKLDKIALGVALGTVCGLLIFVATIILLLKNGYNVGQNLSLLGQYFIGYTVTLEGSFVGLVYGFVAGFVLGFLLALLRNFAIASYLFFIRRKAELSAFNDFFDHL